MMSESSCYFARNNYIQGNSALSRLHGTHNRCLMTMTIITITKLTSRQVIQLVDERLLLDCDDRTLVEVASQPVNFIAGANLPRIIFSISHSEDVLVSRKGILSFCVTLKLDIYKNVILLALHVI